MTRVWSVNGVASTAEDAKLISNHEYALKDVWLEETALTEKEFQIAIFQDIERFCNTTQKTCNDCNKFEQFFTVHKKLVTSGEYKRYFLAIEADSTGLSTKRFVSNKNRGSLSNSMLVTEDKFTHKKQYRVVFEEKCETTGRLRTLGETDTYPASIDVLRWLGLSQH